MPPEPNRWISNPSFRIFVVLIGALVAVLLGALVLGFVSNLLISRELQTVLKQIAVYERPGENPPSGERIRFLGSALNQMKVYLEELRALPFMKNTLVGRRAGDALALKETIYGIERKLREKGIETAVAWPKSFGFEYLQSAIPSDKELPDLFYEIEVFEDIGNAILEAGAISVNAFGIRFPREKSRKAEDVEKPGGVTEFMLDLEAQAPFDRFVNLLDGIRELPHLVTISSFQLKPSEKNPAQVEGKIEIRAVYL
ncbi:MAG: hypothetical protein HY587_00370 [Candidatus Omnitrophica bacterium]|nr:hypothetical protein [Candidatus Omnitrophota bacterium]